MVDNRKEGTSDFKTLCALDSPAKQILMAFTKDRLNKFYNPKLYKPEEAMMMAQVPSHDAPPPPPIRGPWWRDRDARLFDRGA